MNIDDIGNNIAGALFDQERLYRLALWRIWDPSGTMLLYVGLNSSTAAEYRNDPTVVRMVGFGKSWGFGGVFFGNLRSLVTPYPDVLLKSPYPDPPGGLNDSALKKMRERSAKAVVGWGNWGARLGTRPREVLAILGEPVYCLAVTQTGEPGHPLYLRSTTGLIPYVRKES